jgi:hypothetical protein
MAGMGPPPSGHARRRNATTATTTLPAEGRRGEPAPAFPLGSDLTLRAKLAVVLDRVAELEFALAEGKPVQDKLDLARERAFVLRHTLDHQDEAEAELWAELWDTPQAVEWERQRWTREVAMYVRWSVLAGSGDLDAAKEARQLGDRLGLTPMALLRLRWTIAHDEVAEQRDQHTAPAAAEPSRPRLKAVDDAG